MKKLFYIAILTSLVACADNAAQPKEICHYEDACADVKTGGFPDHSGCKSPYKKQVCEEIRY